MDYEKSTLQRRPCYRYIRRADGLPVRDEHAIDPQARVKLFNPSGAGSWYVAEYDPSSRVAYGLVTGLGTRELGYFSMEELVSFRGDFGLPIERDIHFTPRPLSECT